MKAFFLLGFFASQAVLAVDAFNYAVSVNWMSIDRQDSHPHLSTYYIQVRPTHGTHSVAATRRVTVGQPHSKNGLGTWTITGEQITQALEADQVEVSDAGLEFTIALFRETSFLGSKDQQVAEATVNLGELLSEGRSTKPLTLAGTKNQGRAEVVVGLEQDVAQMRF